MYYLILLAPIEPMPDGTIVVDGGTQVLDRDGNVAEFKLKADALEALEPLLLDNGERPLNLAQLRHSVRHTDVLYARVDGRVQPWTGPVNFRSGPHGTWEPDAGEGATWLVFRPATGFTAEPDGFVAGATVDDDAPAAPAAAPLVRDVDPLSAVCSTCNAAIGEPCVDDDGIALSETHHLGRGEPETTPAPDAAASSADVDASTPAPRPSVLERPGVLERPSRIAGDGTPPTAEGENPTASGRRSVLDHGSVLDRGSIAERGSRIVRDPTKGE